MCRFVVERYLPDARPDELRALAAAVAAAGVPPDVRFVRSVIAPSDHAIFSEYEAADEHSVRVANVRAGLTFERVVTVEVSPE